jgi:ribonuclease P protein component
MQATTSQTKDIKHLIKRADFVKIAKQGSKCVTHGVILQAMPNDLGYARIGFTVTKKLEPSAVRRNRIKRRLRAAAADTLSKHAKMSCDYVLIGRPLTATRPYATLCGDLKYCLEKTGFAK